jgi:hypothetical protein
MLHVAASGSRKVHRADPVDPLMGSMHAAPPAARLRKKKGDHCRHQARVIALGNLGGTSPPLRALLAVLSPQIRAATPAMIRFYRDAVGTIARVCMSLVKKAWVERVRGGEVKHPADWDAMSADLNQWAYAVLWRSPWSTRQASANVWVQGTPLPSSA